MSLAPIEATIVAPNVILKITNRVPGILPTLFLYRLLQFLTCPVIFGYFLARLLTQRAYRPHFAERLGFLPRSFSPTNSASIWLHAVSVGEVASALPLLETLCREQPSIPIFVSTSTVAGRRAAERQLVPLVAGIFYFPIDYVSFVRRALKTIRPALVLVLETEIWPNFYAETKRAGASLAILNGRISNRTWPTYLRWKNLFSPILRMPDLTSVQSPVDFERYSKLGAAALQLEANLKYDVVQLNVATSNAARPLALPIFHASHVWVAASTVGPNERGSLTRHSVDEDDLVLSTFRDLTRDPAQPFPRLLLILAPRQQTRFGIVAEKLTRAQIPFVRFTDSLSGNPPILSLPGVLLLDTIGDLARAYPLAQAVFVGGSLAPRGGHNIIEPAAAGVPVVIGPHMHNFEAITRDFLDADAVIQIRNAGQLTSAVRDLLLHPTRAAELGARARQLVLLRAGASGRLAAALWPLYFRSNFRPSRNLFPRLFLRFLSRIWEYGGSMKRARSERYAASVAPLSVPVVSIGGITVGGSGKTPFAICLSTELRSRGYSPAILTRGYHRRSPAVNLVFAPSTPVSPAVTGDESQIFLRSGIAPIGIGASRYETARVLLAQFPSTDVLLLDDGFQHARLHRNLDIVVIDGLDPFGGGGVVPSGRLREPLSALARAHIFVVTRAESPLRFESICAALRPYNPDAPVFRTRLLARRWRDSISGEPMPELAASRVAAFCGLGNPQNFWRTLESLNIDVVFRWSFPDHHSYKPAELLRIARQARMHGAEILVTTEKDRINCPPPLATLIAPFRLAWLEIELELEDPAAFFSYIEKSVRRRSAA